VQPASKPARHTDASANTIQRRSPTNTGLGLPGRPERQTPPFLVAFVAGSALMAGILSHGEVAHIGRAIESQPVGECSGVVWSGSRRSNPSGMLS